MWRGARCTPHLRAYALLSLQVCMTTGIFLSCDAARTHRRRSPCVSYTPAHRRKLRTSVASSKTAPLNSVCAAWCHGAQAAAAAVRTTAWMSGCAARMCDGPWRSSPRWGAGGYLGRDILVLAERHILISWGSLHMGSLSQGSHLEPWSQLSQPSVLCGIVFSSKAHDDTGYDRNVWLHAR